MPRGRGGYRSGGKKIDFKSWFSIPAITLPFTGNATVSGGALLFDIPATVLRIRGELIYQMQATGIAIGDQARVGFGLGIVSQDAFALGATALPDPLGDVSFPWLFWNETNFASELAAATNTAGSAVRRLVVDTKAMRKLKPEEALVAIYQYDDITGTPGVDVHQGQLRTLIGT